MLAIYKICKCIINAGPDVHKNVRHEFGTYCKCIINARPDVQYIKMFDMNLVLTDHSVISTQTHLILT